MSSGELLAVVEVDRADRVQCQAPGCGHAVYKRIHVVLDGGVVSVDGSDCFGRLFAERMPGAAPRYGSSEGRLLTVDERAMLVTNTARLVEQFELERLEALETQRLRREQQEQVAHAEADRLAKSRRLAEPRRLPSDTEIASVEREAKRIVREKFQVDPDAPGWRGLVVMEAHKLLGR